VSIIPPIVPPWIGPKPGSVDDSLAKDEKITAQELLRRGGFPRSQLRTGAAVMGAESGYNPDIDNGICCIGLMQINYKVHKGTKGIPADEEKAKEWLRDPLNNVKVAYAIWVEAGMRWCDGNGNPWEAHCNGAYRKFLGQNPVITVKKNTGSGAIGDAVGDVADAALGPIDEIAGALLSPSTWFRIAKGGFGGAMLVLGTGALVFVIATRSNTVKKAASVAADVVPAGKAAKVAGKAKGAVSGAAKAAT
jgi:hypothetical protein